MEEKIKIIVEHFGLEHQKIKLLEECAELLQGYFKKDPENILEEISDISVLVDQIALKVPIIKEIKKNKINRTLLRIIEEKENESNNK